MRASILVLGPLVARFQADVSLPAAARSARVGESAHQGTPGRSAPGVCRERLHQGTRQTPEGCARGDGFGHRDRHRKHHDGGGAGLRHDGHRERRAGTRGRRSGQLHQRDGWPDLRRRHEHDRDRRRRTPARHRLRRAAGPYRDRHVSRRRCDHRRTRAGQARATEERSRRCCRKLEEAGADINTSEGLDRDQHARPAAWRSISTLPPYRHFLPTCRRNSRR